MGRTWGAIRWRTRWCAPRGAASPSGIAGETLLFLNPELLAVLLALFVGLFLLTDMLFSALARWVDPRLRGGH